MVLRIREEVPGLAERLHTCRKCGWFREVTTSRVLREKVMGHLVWGDVTVLEAARLDVAKHRCEESQVAVAKVEAGKL